MVRAHESMVSALWCGGPGIISGGGDGFVKLYSPALEHQRSYALSEAPVLPLKPQVLST